MRNDHREVVVVTGASAGIGRATARAFARTGADVALLARGQEGLAAAAREVEAAGGRALALPTDVSDPQQVEAAAERVERELGPIDIWVNDATVTVFGSVAAVSPEEFRRVTEVTYLGTVHGTRTALARMSRRNRGTIVQVGSALAYRAIPLQAAYCGAKHAIRGFTDALRCELRHDRSRVRVTLVTLSAFDTPQFDWNRNLMPRRPQPVPPIFEPELAARAIVRAARRPRRELWVGWPAVKAVLASRWLPAGWLDHWLARRGWESQLSPEPARPGQPDNLFAPLPGDHGARGRFGRRARRRSAQAWLSFHRLQAAVALAAGVGAVLAAWGSWRLRPPRAHRLDRPRRRAV